MEGWKNGRVEGWKGGRVEALYVPCKTSKAVSGLEGCGPSQPLKPLWALFRLEFPFFDLFVNQAMSRLWSVHPLRP